MVERDGDPRAIPLRRPGRDDGERFPEPLLPDGDLLDGRAPHRRHAIVTGLIGVEAVVEVIGIVNAGRGKAQRVQHAGQAHLGRFAKGCAPGGVERTEAAGHLRAIDRERGGDGIEKA